MWHFFRIMLLILLPVSVVHAERKEVVVTGKSVITEEVTMNQAKKQALNHARSLAVEEAAGINVTSSLILQNALVVSELIKTFSKGFIVDEQIIEWQNEWVKSSDIREPAIPVVTVKIKALVDVPPDTYFHNYSIDAKINKQTFQSGEYANLEITVKENMYLIVVNYTSDNKIIPIFPFDPTVNNLVTKYTSVEIPGKQKNKFEIMVNTYPGHQRDTEAFIVFGFPVDAQTKEINWFALFKQGEAISYPSFLNRLLALPLSWIAENIVVYSVVSN